MGLGFVIALVLTIPIILIPVALIWYINIGGIYQAIRDAHKRKATENKKPVIDIKSIMDR